MQLGRSGRQLLLARIYRHLPAAAELVRFRNFLCLSPLLADSLLLLSVERRKLASEGAAELLSECRAVHPGAPFPPIWAYSLPFGTLESVWTLQEWVVACL